MIDPANALAILAMACVTYATRVAGYALLRDRALNPRAAAVIEAAPGCVLVALIAPHFATTSPAHLLALAATILAATRLSLLPTILIGMASAGLLRQVLP